MKRFSLRWLLPLAVCFAYFLLCGVFTYPYRLFPGEDGTYLNFPFRWMHMPVFTYSIESCKILARALGMPASTSLLLNVSGSTALTLFFCIQIGSKLCRWDWTKILFGIVFLSSPWPLTYLLMASYSPFSTLLGILVLYGFIRSAPSLEAVKIGTVQFNPTTANPSLSTSSWLAFSGAMAGYLLLSSPSALIMVFLESLFLCFIILQSSPGNRLRSLFIYLGSLVIVIAPFVLRTGAELIEHWYSNLYDSNYPLALKRFAYIPTTPMFSFFRMGMVGTPLLFCSLILFSFFVLWRGIKTRHSFQGKMRLGLLLILWSHGILIDLLPFTKLAHTHYPVYPLVFLISFLALDDLHSIGARWRKVMSVALLLWLVAVFVQNLDYSRKLFMSRQSAVRYFKELPGDKHYYLFQQDPHSLYLRQWLEIEATMVRDISEIRKKPGVQSIILLGPHGSQSGRSVLRASLLPDFLLEPNKIAKPAGATELLLPYYAYFPAFLMEEEVSQGLFFRGASPDYRRKDLQLTVWLY